MELKKYRLNGPILNMKGGALSLVPVEQIPKIHDIEGDGEIEAYTTYEQFKKQVDTLKTQFTAHKTSLNGDKKILTLKRNHQFKKIHDKAKAIALQEGKRLYTRWSQDSRDKIAQILQNFDDNGDVLPSILADERSFFNSATWFNDLYKWTMYPVMRLVEKQAKFGGTPIHVKFQVDIREQSVRDALKEPELQKLVFEALNKLKDRTFERDIFEQVSIEKGNILSTDDIDAICIDTKEPDNKRHLVQVVSSNPNDPVPEDGVVIRCFYRDDLHYDVPKVKEDGTLEQEGEPGLLVIEAEGPWHLVTWLETSMMQCVYETYHKRKLSMGGEGAYNTWLSKALLRCATSVAYTRIMQMCGGPTPALFTGRRTGGLPFLILQNLFFVDHFKQFVPPPTGSKPTIGLYSALEEATACLGTSSVDAVLYLRTLLLPLENGITRNLMKKVDALNVLQFAGTHAHELSMVLSVLYHELDVNPLKLPFSQVLGHYLYEELVRKKTLGPLPMLPDTLGTPAFVIAASILLKDDKTFLSFVNSARQDSGDLVDFETILDTIGYKGGCMASEIDDTATLLKASLLSKFNIFGAGGFFGDSNKVFDDTGINISMAVKVVRVECTYNGEQVPSLPPPPLPTVKISDKDGRRICIGYPIKTGDPSDVNDEKKRTELSKFSADKTLTGSDLVAMKNYAITTRENATKMLLSPELLSRVKAQVQRDVFMIDRDIGVLTVNTTPLQSLKPVFQVVKPAEPAEPAEPPEPVKVMGAVGVGGSRFKRTIRK